MYFTNPSLPHYLLGLCACPCNLESTAVQAYSEYGFLRLALPYLSDFMAFAGILLLFLFLYRPYYWNISMIHWDYVAESTPLLTDFLLSLITEVDIFTLFHRLSNTAICQGYFSKTLSLQSVRSDSCDKACCRQLLPVEKVRNLGLHLRFFSAPYAFFQHPGHTLAPFLNLHDCWTFHHSQLCLARESINSSTYISLPHQFK